MSRFSAPIVNRVDALSSSGGKCEKVRLLPFPPLTVLRTVVNQQENDAPRNGSEESILQQVEAVTRVET
jgi:hypothetical protein